MARPGEAWLGEAWHGVAWQGKARNLTKRKGNKMAKSIPELSVDSGLLYERLKKTEKGETVSYSDLSGIIDRDVQKEGRGYLDTARKMALRLNGLVFEAVRNVGIKCLTDEENASTTGSHAFCRIRRVTSTAVKKLTALDDFDKLSNSAKIQHNTSLSMLGAMSQAIRPNKIKKIEAEVAKVNERLALNKTIEMFK